MPIFDVVTQKTSRVTADDFGEAASIVAGAENGEEEHLDEVTRGDCEVMEVRKVPAIGRLR